MDVVVAKIKKNSSAELWVSLRVFQGEQYIDIREHFFAAADDRQWHPTKKGIMILPNQLPGVIDGIEAMEALDDVGTVATIEKSARDEIQVGIREYERSRYGDVRIWYSGMDGERKPGKGATFKLSMTDALLEALRDAESHLEKVS
jgi:hypothetical protein